MMRALVIAVLALAVLAALLLAGNAWANARVWNARVEIRDEKIPAAFDGLYSRMAVSRPSIPS